MYTLCLVLFIASLLPWGFAMVGFLTTTILCSRKRRNEIAILGCAATTGIMVAIGVRLFWVGLASMVGMILFGQGVL